MNKMYTTESAYAKINLHLEVLDKRPDGYHEIDTVMQTVSLCDTVTVESFEDGKGKTELFCSLSYIPTDEKNIAWKAARAFLTAIARENDSVKIHIEKKIPVAAGLGGGSADGAAVLRALNRLYNYPLDVQALCELATPLGADIPFCIVGGCRRATGIGEVFTEIEPMHASTFLVITMGKIGSNTARAYGKLDAQPKRKTDHLSDGMIEALQSGSTEKIASLLFNRFEEVILPANADASSARRILRIAGAQGALMSGSGAAVFGIFTEEERAEEAVRMLRAKGYFAVIATPVNVIKS